MFNTKRPPIVDFGLSDISQKAQQLTGKLSISGVQPKLPVKWETAKNKIVVTAEGSDYILKPQTGTFPHIPENEGCCMTIAEMLGINTPEHGLLQLQDGSWAYIVKRFDRESGKKIHQEDFAQLLGVTDKYEGSVERMAKKLDDVSASPGYDLQLLFERIVLSFLIGNGDAHLKNYSVSHLPNGHIRLSPVYDLVCSKLVIPGEEDSALTINGKRNRLTRKDFDQLAMTLRVPEKIRYSTFLFSPIQACISNSKLAADKQASFTEIVAERFQRLALPL
jgi:serine/threonine-protein kinase HipA